MRPPKTLKPAPAGAGNRLQRNDQLFLPFSPTNCDSRVLPPVPTIRAELIGTRACVACGITARVNAPVPALCRLLIEAGHDPASRLEAWRGDVLCLKVRAIGEAARLTVDESRVRFVRWKPFSSAAVSSRIARNRKAATPLAASAS
jgi:hypothetical protein